MSTSRLRLDRFHGLLSEGEADVSRRVGGAEIVLMSAIVVGELAFGFHNGHRAKQNARVLADFLDDHLVEFLPVGYATADWFGRLAAQQRKSGRPVATNDLWIAAHAFESGSELLTFDEDFAVIEGLRVEILPATPRRG